MSTSADRSDMGAAAEMGSLSRAPALALSAAEQRAVTRQIGLALAAGGLLALSIAWRYVGAGDEQISQVLAGLASVIVAGPVFAGAWRSLEAPSLHGVTDRLIALAMLAAWAIGDMTTAALLPVVMTLGHALEERSVLGSQEAIRALGQLTQTTVRRVGADGRVEDAPFESMKSGDCIEVVPGARIPADGIVRLGRSSVDNGPITGESVPLEVEEGSAVFGGAMNLDGPLRIVVTEVGRQSTLGKIIELMQRAERAKPPVTQLLEQYIGGYLALVMLIAAIVWFTSSNASAMLAVIVAACPCALVLAAPATAIAGIAAGARHGILFRSAAFLDKLADVDSIVFDKTGTLTYGELRVTHVRLQPGVAMDDVAALAAQLGEGSAHPVSRALVRYADALEPPRIARAPLGRVEELRGLGIIAEMPGGGVAALGRHALLMRYIPSLPLPPEAVDGPCVGLLLGGKLMAWFEFADVLRTEAHEAVSNLRAMGFERQALLTGDRTPVAEKVAAEVGIEIVLAQALPHDKLEFVIEEMRAGRHPLVVGDGLNDLLAIKAGATSIAMGERGIDITVASADVVLLGDDLRRIATCVRLGRHCKRTATINAAIGLAWTVAVIALAALGVLGAVAAALLHNLGTFVVIANAGRLLRIEEGR